jgi:hypothetical protein
MSIVILVVVVFFAASLAVLIHLSAKQNWKGRDLVNNYKEEPSEIETELKHD